MLNTQDEQMVVKKDIYLERKATYDSRILFLISVLISVFHFITNFISYNKSSYTEDEVFGVFYSLFGSKGVETVIPVLMEITALFIFILAIRNMKMKRLDGESDYFAQWTQVLSIFTLFSLAHRLLNLLEVLSDYLSANWESIWSFIVEYRQYVVLAVSLIIILVVAVAFFRYKKRVNKISILGNRDKFLNNLFIWMVISNVLAFLWYYGGLESLLDFQNNNLENEIFVLIIFLFSLVALLATLIHCRKNMKQIPLIMWILCSLCLCGMAPVFQRIGKIERLFRDHMPAVTIITVIVALIFFFWNLNYAQIRNLMKRKSKLLFLIFLVFLGIIVLLLVFWEKIAKAFGNKDFLEVVHILLLILGLVAEVLIVVILIIAIVKTIQKFRHIKIQNTPFWKANIGEIKAGEKVLLYGYIAACLLALCMFLVFFFWWVRNLQQKNADMTYLLSQILVIIILAIVFAFVVIFAMCQIGVYLVRTLKEIDSFEKNQEEKKRSYYGIHGLCGFFTLILSFISWYVYIKIDFSEETAIGVAGEAFRFFAFPVIALLWYAIMFYLFMIVLNGEGEKAKSLYKLIKKRVYRVAKGFVKSIFTPFELFFDFFVVLFDAMRDEEKEEIDEDQDICKDQEVDDIKSPCNPESTIERTEEEKEKKVSADKTKFSDEG